MGCDTTGGCGALGLQAGGRREVQRAATGRVGGWRLLLSAGCWLPMPPATPAPVSAGRRATPGTRCLRPRLAASPSTSATGGALLFYSWGLGGCTPLRSPTGHPSHQPSPVAPPHTPHTPHTAQAPPHELAGVWAQRRRNCVQPVCHGGRPQRADVGRGSPQRRHRKQVGAGWGWGQGRGWQGLVCWAGLVQCHCAAPQPHTTSPPPPPATMWAPSTEWAPSASPTHSPAGTGGPRTRWVDGLGSAGTGAWVAAGRTRRPTQSARCNTSLGPTLLRRRPVILGPPARTLATFTAAATWRRPTRAARPPWRAPRTG